MATCVGSANFYDFYTFLVRTCARTPSRTRRAPSRRRRCYTLHAELCTAVHETVQTTCADHAHIHYTTSCTTPGTLRAQAHPVATSLSLALHGVLLDSGLCPACAIPRARCIAGSLRCRARRRIIAPQSALPRAGQAPHCAFAARCLKDRERPRLCTRAQSTQAWHTQRRVLATARRAGC